MTILDIRESGKHTVTFCVNYFWLPLKCDIVAHIKTCHTSKVTGQPNHFIKPAPLCLILSWDNPFEHLITDCLGPLWIHQRFNRVSEEKRKIVDAEAKYTFDNNIGIRPIPVGLLHVC